MQVDEYAAPPTPQKSNCSKPMQVINSSFTLICFRTTGYSYILFHIHEYALAACFPFARPDFGFGHDKRAIFVFFKMCMFYFPLS
jgi:hypothetical protein